LGVLDLLDAVVGGTGITFQVGEEAFDATSKACTEVTWRPRRTISAMLMKSWTRSLSVGLSLAAATAPCCSTASVI
jgi:hypothetical protein